MTHIEIWQAPFDQTAFGFDAGATYARVWAEDIDGDMTIDEVWERFQRVDEDTGPWPPEGYTGRSLSIGDVVVLDGARWTPLPVGWRQLDEGEGA